MMFSLCVFYSGCRGAAELARDQSERGWHSGRGYRMSAGVAAVSLFVSVCCPLQATAKGGAPSVQTCVHTRGHHDGDTFVCVPADGVGFKVRVASIDTPETGQAFWRVARQRLRELAADGSAVACRQQDRYGREVCSVTSPVGQDVAETMLREGLGWYPEAYAREDTPVMRSVYRSRQEEAGAAGRALWSQEMPMAPWACRADRKKGQRCR